MISIKISKFKDSVLVHLANRAAACICLTCTPEDKSDNEPIRTKLCWDCCTFVSPKVGVTVVEATKTQNISAEILHNCELCRNTASMINPCMM